MTKTIKTLLIFLPLIFLIGCGPSEEEIREQVRLELEQEESTRQQALQEQKKIQKKEILAKWYEARNYLNEIKNSRRGSDFFLLRNTSIKVDDYDVKTLVFWGSYDSWGDMVKAVNRLGNKMGIPGSIRWKIETAYQITHSYSASSTKTIKRKHNYENVDMEYDIECYLNHANRCENRYKGVSIRIYLRLTE